MPVTIQITDLDRAFMRRAVELSLDNVAKGSGGPFGAVVVKDGVVIAEGANQVVPTHDPTAHAEIVALRKACAVLRSFQLKGCTIYSSCEPCPMCLGAIYWARPSALYFANTRIDAAAIGFDDQMIYDELRTDDLTHRSLPTYHLVDEHALEAFIAWRERDEKIRY